MTARIPSGCTFRDASGQCPELATNRGRCPEHQRKPWRHKEGRETAASRGYGQPWVKLRTRKLRETPRCEKCGDTATEVDHIMPLAEGGARLSMGNLQSLCEPCHKAKTQQEAQRARRDTR